MSRFFLFEEQDGGCDYTIGCGYRLTEIKEVSSMAGAILKVSGGDKYGEFIIDTDREFPVNKASILQVKDVVEIDIDKLARERRRLKEEEVSAQKEKADREKYEELKRKFG